MKYPVLAILMLAYLFSNAQYQAQLELELYASGFEEPVDIANAGDRRLFIVEKDGLIKIIDADGLVLDTPFIDIDSRVNSGANERGLLGLVFHPDYENNGYFYVNYTTLDGTTRISRFSVSSNPDVADVDSELIILAIPQLHHNHNGGDLNFGPDGYLYIGMGDGGFSGDPENQAQNRQSLLGKMLRIDVDNPATGMNYGIPSDNPFVGDNTTLDEIWALGLRNPWRFSFDRQTGDMWIGDVGQDELEEIDFQPATSTGGENYGWRCYEGTAPFDPDGCPADSTFTLPIHTYQNGFSTGCSVTGGFVYRGEAVPNLVGQYLYADYCSGRFWTIKPDGVGGWIDANVGDFADEEFSSFGENMDGELYVAAYAAGEIYRIEETCSATVIEPAITNESCPDNADGAIDLTVTGGTPPLTYEWSTGATTEDLSGLTGGIYDVVVTDALNCITVLNVEVLTDTTSNTPIATASHSTVCEGDTIVLTASGASEGYTYQWYDAIAGTNISGATDSIFLHTEGDGLYSVFAVGECPSEKSNPVMVSVEDFIMPLINGVSGDSSIDLFCPLESAVLTASEAPTSYTYQWYLNDTPMTGATEMTLKITEEGTYTVEYVGDGSVCTQSSPFLDIASMTTPILPVISEISDNTLMVTVSNTNYDYTYQWYLNGGLIQDTNSDTYQVTESGIYTVEVTLDFYGCSEISPEFDYMIVGTAHITGLNAFNVSPVPAKDILNIHLTTNKQLNLTLHIQNTQGQILLQQQTTVNGDWKNSLDISRLPGGIYLLTLISENGIAVRKILK